MIKDNGWDWDAETAPCQWCHLGSRDQTTLVQGRLLCDLSSSCGLCWIRHVWCVLTDSYPSWRHVSTFWGRRPEQACHPLFKRQRGWSQAYDKPPLPSLISSHVHYITLASHVYPSIVDDSSSTFNDINTKPLGRGYYCDTSSRTVLICGNHWKKTLV